MLAFNHLSQKCYPKYYKFSHEFTSDSTLTPATQLLELELEVSRISNLTESLAMLLVSARVTLVPPGSLFNPGGTHSSLKEYHSNTITVQMYKGSEEMDLIIQRESIMFSK